VPLRSRKNRKNVLGGISRQIGEGGERQLRLRSGGAGYENTVSGLLGALDAGSPQGALSDPGLSFEDESSGGRAQEELVHNDELVVAPDQLRMSAPPPQVRDV
jgi:hypothetical protein